MKFNGSSGRKPQAEARRYVYAVHATAIEMGGEGLDRRLVVKAAKAVAKELRRKAQA